LALAGPTRAHVEPNAVTIIDTPEGRIVAGARTVRRQKVDDPGAGAQRANITAAVNRMMRRLPANDEWFSYRKVV